MLKSLAHRVVLRTERLLDGAIGRRRAGLGGRTVQPYLGYATRDTLILRGRVLLRGTRQEASTMAGRLTNLRNMLALFLTRELQDVRVTCGNVETRTDEEGYFKLTMPRTTAGPGWSSLPVEVEGCDTSVECRCLVPRSDARFMVISDIDDTVMRTGAYSLVRNLWTTFTGNVSTRHVFPDAISLMNDLWDDGRNPVFYVSSSPWNLHEFLENVFSGAGLVSGPMFLRDLGVSEAQFITSGHGAHKGQSIDTLLAANPDLPVILIGDTGQKDARIYRAAIERHPGRVAAVVLRVPRPGNVGERAEDLDLLTGTGVPVLTGADFRGVAENLKRRL